MNLLRHGRTAPTDYRALVCVFMDGGNDSNNMVDPERLVLRRTSTRSRGPRPPGSRSRVGSLVPLNNPREPRRPHLRVPPEPRRDPALYPGRSPYNAEQARRRHERRPARRAGATRRTSTRKPTPYSLFSHSDQIDCWQTGRADQRIVDRLGRPHRPTPTLTCNGGSGFPTITTIAGASTFCVGAGQRPARDRHRARSTRSSS